MKRIQIMVYALLLLVSVSALLPAASDSTLDIISYDDQGIERSLAGGCSSTARVTCVLANSEGVPCEGNLQVVNSDCKNKVKQPQKVEVTWQYCNNNTGTVVQNVDLNRTVAVYKKSEQETTTAKLRAGECRTITRKPKINLCKRGAAMSMKYRGSLSSGQICYAYNFVRVKTKRLRRKKAKCAVTTEVTCQINEGANIGLPCAGNIINDGACKTVKVQFTYKICVFNRDANKMFINPNKSIAKMQGTKVPLNTKNMVTKNSPCRMDTKDAEIGTCSTNDVNAMLKVRGRLNTGKKCRSKSYLKIRAAEPCTYDFIITELVSNGSKSYIEIYSPNCRNAVVAEDFHIVRYNNPGKETPNRDNPITLRGLETNEDGFIIICASEQAGQEFCENVNEETATLTGTDTIAIIRGNIDTDLIVYDVFGRIPKPNSDTQLALQDFSGSQAVRNKDAIEQDPTFDSGHWTITSKEEYNLTPGSWHDINNNFVPRSGGGNGSAGKVNSSSKSSKSSKSDSKSPSDSPSPTTSKSPSKTPKSSKSDSKSPSDSPSSTNSESIPRLADDADSLSPSPSKTSRRPKNEASKGSGKGSKNPSKAPTPQLAPRDAGNTKGSNKTTKSPSIGKGTRAPSKAPE